MTDHRVLSSPPFSGRVELATSLVDVERAMVGVYKRGSRYFLSPSGVLISSFSGVCWTGI
jgi:hypothetical protein